MAPTPAAMTSTSVSLAALVHTEPSRTPRGGWYKQVAARIYGFTALEDDWDGEGARAPLMATLDLAARFAWITAQAGMRPSVGLASDGSVVFEWNDPSARAVAVDVRPDGSAETTVLRENRIEKEFQLPVDLAADVVLSILDATATT
jgi:hypothetical protein